MNIKVQTIKNKSTNGGYKLILEKTSSGFRYVEYRFNENTTYINIEKNDVSEKYMRDFFDERSKFLTGQAQNN